MTLLSLLLSLLCFVLSALALNSMFLGMILAFMRANGSALLFAAGVFCLVSLLALAVTARIDIAPSFGPAGLTLPLGVSLLARRGRIRRREAPGAEPPG